MPWITRLIRLTRVIIPLLAVAAVRLSYAQSAPRFEVASVKENTANDSGRATRITRTPGRLMAVDADLEWLLQMAFQTRLLDISQVPNSLRTERFDIVAKAAGKITGDQYWEMLQTLLEDLFKVTYHRETKDAQVFALILAKKGSNTAQKLSRSNDAECPVNPNDTNFCGVGSRPGFMTGQRVSMARIARELSPFAGRPVLDETGLTGSFDFQLTWTPDPGESKRDGDKFGAGDIALDPSGSSFFSAIQDQLGLKFESKKAQVQILIIDHVERPSID